MRTGTKVRKTEETGWLCFLSKQSSATAASTYSDYTCLILENSHEKGM